MGSKICIIGCGRVGATAGFVLAASGLCGEIVLIDEMQDKARGEAMDIAHASVIVDTVVRAGDYADIADSSVIIFAAGVGRKPGESRFDLAVKNVTIARSVAENIKKYYTTGVVLVVTNPVDVVTYIMTEALGLPKGRVIGTGTTLDTARLKDEISKHFKVDKSDIIACVMGEHGDSAVPIWNLTSIYGINIADYAKTVDMPFDDSVKSLLLNRTKAAGADIIALKGATYYGIAAGILSVCKEILHNTNALLPVSAKLEGEYGLRDTAISLIGGVGKNGLNRFLTPFIGQEEIALLKESGIRVETEIKKLL